MKTKSILSALLGLFAVYTLVFQGCYKEDFCTADFYADTTYGLTPLSVHFHNDSDPWPLTSWHWDFGDGDTSMLENPYHTYLQAGEYTVSLTVNKTNYDSDTEIKEYYINVSDSADPPDADFYADTTSGTTPALTVNFFDQSTNDPVVWMWTFGDGGASSQQNPSHVYIDEGEYTVALTVSNASGIYDTETKEFYIYVNEGEKFTDPRDGQSYFIRYIGSQRWFIENLNYETTNSSWYDNNSANGDIYGRLYNWEDALTACPEGWHLPSDDEWKTLEMHLGMSQSDADLDGIRNSGDVGSKIKSTYGWNIGNGTNSSGFSAFPGGYSYNGSFSNSEYSGYFWTSTENFPDYTAWRRYLNQWSGIQRNSFGPQMDGMSVRCVMNQTD